MNNMPQFQIISDGTIKGTQLIKDGADLTEDSRVVSLSFSAHASWEEIDVSYVIEEDYIDADGNKNGVERVSYRWSTDQWIRETQNEQAPKSVPSLALGKSSDETEGKIGGKKLIDLSEKDKLKRLFG